MRSQLEAVAAWYSSQEGFYARLVEYDFASIHPYLVGSKCLELGPADGQMTRLLAGVFDGVTCVDGSSSFCQRLRRQFAGERRINVECALFEEYEPQGAFDTIVMAHVLEHLEDPVYVLQRIRRWLSHGGKFIVLVPNAGSIHRRVGVHLGVLGHPDDLNDLDRRLGHRRVYTRSLLDAHLSAGGWTVETTGGVFFKPLSNGQIEKWFTPEMADAFYELGKEFPELDAEIFAVAR